MLWPVLALIGVVGLDVRLEEARGLSDEERIVLTEAVYARATARGATGTLRLRALAIPGTLRITVARAGVTPPRVAHADLVGAPAAWAPTIDAALDAIGLRPAPPDAALDAPPDPAPPDAALDASRTDASTDLRAPPPATQDTALVAEPPRTDERAPPILAWSLLGGAVVTGAAGAVFGVVNTVARDEGEPLLGSPERDVFDDRARVSGVAANVLFGVAAGALIAGVVLLVTD